MADITLGPGQNIWLYYDPGREAWTSFITAHSSGGLGGGLNAGADETISGNWSFTGSGRFDADAVQIKDTDGSHFLILTPGSNLTANRVLTLTTGDAARTVTISGNATISQDYSATGSPTFAAPVCSTSLSTPSIITASGALTVTPAAGSNLSVALSTTGDFVVNTDDLVVDTSTGNVGIGTASPGVRFTVIDTANTITNFVAGSGVNTAELAWGSTGSGRNVLLYSQGGLNSGFLFRTRNSSTAADVDAVTLTGDGRLGIGATGPNNVLDVAGNVCVGNTAAGTSATRTLVLTNGTVPSSSPADAVQLYAEDVAASSELKVRDEGGTVTTLSPHNFSLLGKPSEPMAWSHYSERHGRAINVDLLAVVREVEALSGKSFVKIAPVRRKKKRFGNTTRR